jgi:hypothetical protein
MTIPPIPLSLPRRRIGLSSAVCRDDHHRDILFGRAWSSSDAQGPGSSRRRFRAIATPVDIRR